MSIYVRSFRIAFFYDFIYLFLLSLARLGQRRSPSSLSLSLPYRDHVLIGNATTTTETSTNSSPTKKSKDKSYKRRNNTFSCIAGTAKGWGCVHNFIDSANTPTPVTAFRNNLRSTHPGGYSRCVCVCDF